MHYFERTKDKLAIVGFATATRDMAPWDNPDYEIWSLNEAPNFPFIKRFDRLFQLHPRWDFSRENCANDHNHFHWLRNVSEPCRLCKGHGTLVVKEEAVKCPANGCNNGIYTPLPNRDTTLCVYMQEEHPDIPHSVKYPLKEAAEVLDLNGYKYFTSSFAYMITLAYMMGFRHVEIYGFEMGASTEYHYQRPNAEYLLGYFKGLGMNIVVPDGSTLRHGLLYGYENMRTGYRQQMDMRIAVLEAQLKVEETNSSVMLGRVVAAKEHGITDTKYETEYQNQIGLVNVIKGALRETKNLISLYDTYFIVGSEAETNAVRKDTDKHVGTVYKAQ